MLPELVRVRDEPEAAPARRQRHVLAEPLLRARVEPLELGAVGQRPALRRRPRRQPAAERPGAEVRLRLLGRRPARRGPRPAPAGRAAASRRGARRAGSPPARRPSGSRSWCGRRSRARRRASAAPSAPTACRRGSRSRAPSTQARRGRHDARRRTSARTGAAGRDRDRAPPSRRDYSPLSYPAPPMATTRTIDIRTAIPGPRSQAILERKQRVIANAKSIVLPIVAHEGRGATLTDVDGNTFIDFTGGVGCLNTGHAHPRVVEAATEQLARFAHTDFTVVPYEPYVELAERLLAQGAVPRPGEGRVLQRRHRGGRERRQVRAPLHQAPRRDRLRGRLPRPHAAFDDPDVAAASVQGRDGPAGAGGLPGAVPVRLPRPRHRDRARRAAPDVPDAGRRRAGRGDHRRARSGRGRLPARAAGVHGGPAVDLRRATASA